MWTKRRHVDILVVGLEQVLPKVSNWVHALEHEGITSLIYSQDILGLTKQSMSQLDVQVILVPEFWGKFSRWTIGLPLFVALLLWYRPRHIEVYDPELCNRFFQTCVEFAFVLGFPIVVLNRGGLYGFDKMVPAQQYRVKRIYAISELVLVKELYMEEQLLASGLAPRDKIVLVHNRIRIGVEPPLERTGSPLVLYLNNLRRWKRADLCIQAIALVRHRIPDVELWIVGDVSSYMASNLNKDVERQGNETWEQFSKEDLVEIARRLEVEDCVNVLPFTQHPEQYYNKASVFLFPSDLVFCNFSLLEAMERGVPPIVSAVEGSELIVENSVSGFRVPQDAQAISDRLIELLSDEPTRQAMGRAARVKIMRDFNVEDTAKILAKVYSSKVWERA